MAVRPVDANAMLNELRPVSFEAEHSAVLLSDVSKMMREWVERQPTLTPPNETPPCYQPDGEGCAYQCYDGQDEPIDKCKECPLCYSDKQRHHTPKQRHHTPPNEWVSVEQAMPPEHETVLCIVSGKPKPNIMLEDAYQLGSWNKADGWIIDEWLDWEGANVTWWMKLPEPPDRRPPEGEA